MPVLPSALDFLNALARSRAVEVTRNVGYGPHDRHRLDIYHAAGSPTEQPLAVFFYGGSWEEGERSDYFFVGAALAARGITTIVADYRVFPDVRFPSFVEDGAAALHWVASNMTGGAGGPKRVIAIGHSAGAYIAAMLALDGRWLAAVGLDATGILSGFVGLAGPYDFLPLHSDTLKQIFGPEAQLPATQPINYVTGSAPPCLLATGRNDRTVEPGNSMRLAERIRAAGGEAAVTAYEHLNHRTLIGAFSPALRFLGPVLDDTVSFVFRYTAAGDYGRAVRTRETAA